MAFKYYLTSPSDFLGLDNSDIAEKGSYKWCTDTGDCKKGLCALVDVSLKKGKIYENLEQDTDRVELVPCDANHYFEPTFVDPFTNEYHAKHKIKYTDETAKDTFRMTQLGVLTELGDSALMTDCYEKHIANAGFCEGVTLEVPASATQSLLPSKCTHINANGDPEYDIPGFVCKRNTDGRKAFYSCLNHGNMTAGKSEDEQVRDDGYLTAHWFGRYDKNGAGIIDCVHVDL